MDHLSKLGNQQLGDWPENCLHEAFKLYHILVKPTYLPTPVPDFNLHRTVVNYFLNIILLSYQLSLARGTRSISLIRSCFRSLY